MGVESGASHRAHGPEEQTIKYSLLDANWHEVLYVKHFLTWRANGGGPNIKVITRINQLNCFEEGNTQWFRYALKWILNDVNSYSWTQNNNVWRPWSKFRHGYRSRAGLPQYPTERKLKRKQVHK